MTGTEIDRRTALFNAQRDFVARLEAEQLAGHNVSIVPERQANNLTAPGDRLWDARQARIDARKERRVKSTPLMFDSRRHRLAVLWMIVCATATLWFGLYDVRGIAVSVHAWFVVAETCALTLAFCCGWLVKSAGPCECCAPAEGSP